MADMMGQLPMILVFSALIFLTWRDLIHTEQSQDVQKDIKAPKLSKFAGPTLKFMFWWEYCSRCDTWSWWWWQYLRHYHILHEELYVFKYRPRNICHLILYPITFLFNDDRFLGLPFIIYLKWLLWFLTFVQYSSTQYVKVIGDDFSWKKEVYFARKCILL